MKQISTIVLALFLAGSTQAIQHKHGHGHHHRMALVQDEPAVVAAPAVKAPAEAPAKDATSKVAEAAKQAGVEVVKPGDADAPGTIAEDKTAAVKEASKESKSDTLPIVKAIPDAAVKVATTKQPAAKAGYKSPYAFGKTDITEAAPGSEKATGTPSKKVWPKPWYYVDGNGGGSEKSDAYWHIGNETKKSADFDDWAWKNPAIHNVNYWDKEPMSHSNGITSLNQQQQAT